MIPCLLWKVRVVLSFILGFSFIFITQSGLSQPSVTNQQSKKITFSVRDMRIEDAIRELEKITRLHFVYSSDKIEKQTRVTVNIIDRSLDEVLGLISAQTRLSFKRKEQYVIVKTGGGKVIMPVKLPQPRPESKILHYTLALPDSAMLHASASAAAARPELSNLPELGFSKRYFKNHFQDLGMYFDTTRLNVLPAKEVKQINIKSRHRGWFISAGPRLSEHSMGAEIMGGIRSLYVVYNPGVLKSGKYHGAFGLGTSMLLSGDFSFHPMYTYFVIKEKSLNASVLAFEAIASRSDLGFTARHHQLKLMIQYAFSKNLNLRFGPIVNSLHTTFYYPQQKAVLLLEEPVTNGNASASTTKQAEYYPSLPPQTGRTQYLSRNPEKMRLWMNWEATLSFKLNFFTRK